MFLEDMKINESSFESTLEEMTVEFWIYLSTRGERLETELSRFICFRQWDKLKRKLASMFYYYLREQKRNTFYRHIRQVLSECSQCICQSQGGYTAYAFTETEDVQVLGNDFYCLPQYSSWPHPDIPTNQINTKQGIIRAACFFWHETKSRLGNECLVPVRELIFYLHSQYNLNEIYLSTSTEADISSPDNGESKDRDSENILDHLAQGSPAICQYNKQPEPYSKDRLRDLAHKLVHRFTEEQFRLFCMKYFQDLSLRAIASKLGYKRESGAAYHLNKVHAKIKEFCSMWPSLSPPDYDETVFLAFFDQMVLFCR